MIVLRYIVLLVSVLALSSCGKDQEKIPLQPVAFFRMLPAAGNTTTVFHFNADSAVKQGSRENPVLIRWDWDSDGKWDRMYSTGGDITHRFYKPGSYRIIMEASTLFGKRDSMILPLTIEQGYSPPRAMFRMVPDSANILTEFVFDASLTKDDEDSLGQLEFRWDLNGDQIWDTEFSSSPVISRTYSENAYYQIKLEVRDPQKMTSIKTSTLIVNRLNGSIVPIFSHECWPCTIEDTVKFDGSGSYYTGNAGAKLLYSWDIGSDNIWEESLSTSPYFNKIIDRLGKTKVRLRVTDEQGLYMDYSDSVELFPLNSAPVTVLVIGNRIGNTGSRYFLHLRESRDRDNSVMDLVPRWDVDNDGIWDTQYDGKFEIYLTFPVAGKYAVTAMISDPNNKSTMDTDTVWVVAGNHETGLLEDKRTDFLPHYYGTVKIGNNWWMQSNLRFYPTGKNEGLFIRMPRSILPIR